MADKRDRVDDVEGEEEAAAKKLKVTAPGEAAPATTTPAVAGSEAPAPSQEVATTQPATAATAPASAPAAQPDAGPSSAAAPAAAAAATAGPSGGGATAHSDTGLATGRQAEAAAAAGGTGEAMDTQEAEAARAAEEGTAPGPSAANEGAAAPDEPVKIGYKTFVTGVQASDYFHHLSSNLRHEQNLNEYEEHMLMQLLKQGHPTADKKMEGGVSGIQLREHRVEGKGTVCFHVMRPDGTCEDFSVWKCLASLFPAWSKTASRPNVKAGGGGRGRGGGRGGRGRGGRRGRGRARGGRR